MKIIMASIGLGVGLLALALPASAGPCSGEIETLTRRLATSGAGTNLGASPNVPSVPAAPTLPKAPTTSGTLPANPLEPGQPPKLPGATSIAKAPSTAGTLPPNPLESSSGNKVTDPGAMTGGGDAAATLRRAQELDQAGDEAGCMAEIAKAKNLIGIQ